MPRDDESEPMMPFAPTRRVLFVHAHPDDETLATGALIAALVARGVAVDLVTCTRGERGELVAGVLPETTSATELVQVREQELATAVAHLGIDNFCYLGEPPASHDGHVRRYEDSGMEWGPDGVARPAPETGAAAFTRQALDAQVADLLAFITHTRPEAVVSYDRSGGYGHPDHIRAHQIARSAAGAAGLDFWQLAPDESDLDGVEWGEWSGHRAVVNAAHDAHRTQFTRVGDQITHVGGQQHPVRTRIGLARLHE